MKPWLIRSSSFLLTASLVLPAGAAYAHTPLPLSGQTAPAATAARSELTGSLLAAASKAKLSKEEALVRAQKLVSTKGLELANVSFRSADPWRPFPEWSFNWVKKVANSEEIALSYNVSIHADTGEISAYSRYVQGASNIPYAKRISYEDARKKAESFLARYNPGKAEQTRLYTRDMPAPKTPLNADVSYSFRFVRVVDGVLFPENSADITVNSAGDVVGYSLTWNDVQFEKPARTISQEEAEKRLIAQTTARLSYLLPWEKTGEDRNKPVLAYQNPFSFYLDAATGTALSPASLAPFDSAQEPEPVSDKALPARYNGPALSQEEVAKLASETFDLGAYELRSANYSENDYRGTAPSGIWSTGKKETATAATRTCRSTPRPVTFTRSTKTCGC